MWSYTVMDTLLLLTSLVVFGGITDGDAMTSRATFVVHVTGTAREDQTLTLSCYLSGPPASSITLPSSYIWVKDGKVIPEKTEGTLTLGPLTSKDVGDYECGASELDISRESHHLEVILSPMVHILPMTPDLVVKGVLGEKLTLTCEVTQAFPEVPADGYSWDHLPTLEGPVRHLMENTSTLRLGPLTKEDSGQYVCQARNDQDYKTMTLVGKASVTVDIVYLQEISVTTNRDVNEGDMAVITCSVDSHPTARLTWIVDGNEVGQVTDNVDYYVIPQVACSDGTNYTCRATNPDLPDREETATTRLQVKCVKDGASVLPKPRIYQNEGIAYIGYPLMLHCYTSSPADDGLTYIWFKDSQKVKADPSPFYWFARVKKGDRGVYTCQTSLEKPRALSSTSDPLTVHPRDPPETMVKKKEQQHYDRTKRSTRLPTPVIIHDSLPVCGKTLSLQCLIMGKYDVRDHIVYTWYKDNKVYKENWGQILWFQNISEADKGMYTCTASKGPPETTSHPSFFFDIDPVFYPHLRIKQATAEGIVKGKIGENVTLTCEVIKSNPMVPYTGYSWSYLPRPQALKQPLKGNRRIMILGPLTKESKGQYFCQARNDQNYQTVTLIGNTSVVLEVVYLVNTSVTPDLNVSEGEAVTLKCQVDSNPTPRLSWTFRGQEVRFVEHDIDYFVIMNATCSDSGTYMCKATNAHMPGHQETASTQLHVNCMREISQHQPSVFQSGVPVRGSAFSLVCVVPESSSFNDYTGCTWCKDSRQVTVQACPVLHFENVTEADEGEYTCTLAMGPANIKSPPSVAYRLTLTGLMMNTVQSDCQDWIIVVITLAAILVAVLIAVIIIIIHRRKFAEGFFGLEPYFHTEGFPLAACAGGSIESKKDDSRTRFDNLYEKGNVYIFPNLVSPERQATADHEEVDSGSTDPLLPPDSNYTMEFSEFIVKDLVRFILKECIRPNDLPSFLLHNTHLSKNEKILLILSRRLGIVLMCVKTTIEREVVNFIGEALNCLIEAREAVRKKLEGLVKSEAVIAVLALPNHSKDDTAFLNECLRTLHEHPDLEILFGKEKNVFKQWAKRLSRRRDSELWVMSPSDTAFEVAATKFLTLGGYHPEDFVQLPTTVKSRLLTPAQMEVRDSPAKLTHIWGPPGEGKTTLLLYKALEWLADEMAVIVVGSLETYSQLISFSFRNAIKENREGKHFKLRICRMPVEMKAALKELKSLHPRVKICIITDILHLPGMFPGVLDAVKSKEAYAVFSTFTENLHTIDSGLSKECYKLGWKNVHLPQLIRPTEDTDMLMHLLATGSLDQELGSETSSRSNKGNLLKVVDHCRHLNVNLAESCVQCKEELIPALPSSDQDPQWNGWNLLHTGNPHMFTDLQPLCKILCSLDVPAALAMTDSLATVPSIHAADVDTIQKHSVPLLWVNDFSGVKKAAVLVVHWDDRDYRKDCQSREVRNQRLAEHRQQWMQAASCSSSQVILLLLTPSPARGLLNLPDPAMLMQTTNTWPTQQARKLSS